MGDLLINAKAIEVHVVEFNWCLLYKDNMNIYYRYWLSRTDHNKLIFVQMYIQNPMHFKNIVYV